MNPQNGGVHVTLMDITCMVFTLYTRGHFSWQPCMLTQHKKSCFFTFLHVPVSAIFTMADCGLAQLPHDPNTAYSTTFQIGLILYHTP